MLACQPEGYEAVFFFLFFYGEISKEFTKLIVFALGKPKFPNFFV
jgi:hypothetical protein